jgi:two-component sensor histidine kinase/PAS domain-containing protein
VRAVITVPLVRDGELKAMLFVHEPSRALEALGSGDGARRRRAELGGGGARGGEQSLRESEDHYRHTVELNPQVTWTALPDGQLNRVSRRWQDWTGTTGLGESWAEGLHPDDRERPSPPGADRGHGRALRHRAPREDARRQLSLGPLARLPAPRRGRRICLWYGSTEDIHEQKVAEERQRLLINELNHRVKNTLATVQAIAFQTLKGDIPLAEARSRFEARLLALSRAHNLLTEQNWEGAGSSGWCATRPSISPARSRFRSVGPPVWLAPRAALALALALHELGTNAAKYGALSATAAPSTIAGRGGDTLRLDWKESGGPPVVAPTAAASAPA